MACDPRRAGSRKKKPGDGRARTPPPGFGPTADVLRQRGRIPDISNLRVSGHLKLALTNVAAGGAEGSANAQSTKIRCAANIELRPKIR